ncbi:hypothetical protein BCF11_0944 [Collimonas sp. PA-H2]|nr:hypothetical protein BCF11_0944 [Collimonas sp. PA-H2]
MTNQVPSVNSGRPSPPHPADNCILHVATARENLQIHFISSLQQCNLAYKDHAAPIPPGC